MTPLLQSVLTIAGFLALTASLFVENRAGWFALLGAGAVLPLAVRDADPVLALGLLALLAARFIRLGPPAPGRSHRQGAYSRKDQAGKDS